jgi:hypothetical protein
MLSDNFHLQEIFHVPQDHIVLTAHHALHILFVLYVLQSDLDVDLLLEEAKLGLDQTFILL